MVCEEHKPAIRWEINPQTGVMTKRCPRCGHILEQKATNARTEFQDRGE